MFLMSNENKMSYAAEGEHGKQEKGVEGQKNVDIAARGVGSNGWLGPGVVSRVHLGMICRAARHLTRIKRKFALKCEDCSG